MVTRAASVLHAADAPVQETLADLRRLAAALNQ